MKLTVRTPATSANLGSGFDSLGLALDVWATVTVETVEGPQRPVSSVMRLVQQGISAAFEEAGKAPSVVLSWDNTIPVARGLGASASLRAAGLLAGNTLLGNVHDADKILALGTKLEGHPDNMAPALLGGLQVVVHTEERVLHLQAGLPADLRVVVFVPDFEMNTQEGRRKLPRQLSREDTVYNVGRVALLVAALGAGAYEYLDEATQDKIHQPARSEIFPGLQPIMAAAKAAGAAASYLSGGGSTVAAFVRAGAAEDAVAAAIAAAAQEHGYTGRSIVTAPTRQGAHIVA